MDVEAAARTSVISELGLETHDGGDVVLGDARNVAELCYPGTEVIRTSVLATWADITTGVLSGRAIEPRIPVTLDLDVQVLRVPAGDAEITLVASIIKAGRQIVVCDAWFHEVGVDEPFASSTVSFMAAPGAEHVMPGGFPVAMARHPHLLFEPLADRAGVSRLGPGVVEIEHTPQRVNATGSIQGGIVALAAEEAVRAAAPDAQLESLAVRYLRPYRSGPAHAESTVAGNVAHIRITEGAGGKISTIGTARIR